ncbi:hypothetical protein C3941_00860 [Kaistia algarum]|uniref:EF-hand domain-containing protein n=1 Tax=Kaistia algarum TaxID=2083279 RepID=UPI000CE91521|nr:EF-hand domain-containing protein [Kaistia algarum]MCX5513233.1 EF-hand domain-containing protein [Kaistia algarum]PPE81304.1 hypothetical protein C3941_00860 [Kaistia algarum]
MKKLIISAGLAMMAASLALPAAADEPAPPRAKMMFWFLDRNGDGFIDASEIEAFRTAQFRSIDQDGSGTLTKAEATTMIETARRPGHGGKMDGAKPDKVKLDKDEARGERFAKREAAMLRRLGFTGDVETITLAEFVAKEPGWFKRADKNADGKIDQAEFLASWGSKAHRAMPD